MKVKSVQRRSPANEGACDAATSTALQVKRGITIGALARATGLKPSAIRYYERLGLMPAAPRRSGWREYGTSDTRRLKQLVAARALGFSLQQLKALGEAMSDRPALESALAAKAAELDANIRALQSSRATIAALLTCSCTSARMCSSLDQPRP